MERARCVGVTSFYLEDPEAQRGNWVSKILQCACGEVKFCSQVSWLCTGHSPLGGLVWSENKCPFLFVLSIWALSPWTWWDLLGLDRARTQMRAYSSLRHLEDEPQAARAPRPPLDCERDKWRGDMRDTFLPTLPLIPLPALLTLVPWSNFHGNSINFFLSLKATHFIFID